MRSDADKIAYAQDLIRRAGQQGLISDADARTHLRELGAEDTREQAVTITLRVTGDVAQARALGGEVSGRVERALAATAREAGLNVVGNSTRVQFA
jgi:hypothetical protein